MTKLDPADVTFVTFCDVVQPHQVFTHQWPRAGNTGNGCMASIGTHGWWYGSFTGEGGYEAGQRVGRYEGEGWNESETMWPEQPADGP